MRLRTLTLALAFCCALHAVAQEQAPPPAEQKVDKAHQKEVDGDKGLGDEYSKQVAKELKFSEDKEKTARVERIGKEFADIANSAQVDVTWGDPKHSQFDYKFHVVKGEDVNAFSIPGGYIYIYEGLVDFSESDDELASVIAHEVAHAALRHIATMQKEQGKFDLVNVAAVLAAIWSRKDATKILVPTQLLNLGVRSGWSVNAEMAADYAGVQYMVKSKYNPLGALTFLERLGYKNRFRPEVNWGIFETHPPTEERATAMLAHLRESTVLIARSATSSSLRATNKIGDKGIELWFGAYKIHVFAGDEAQKRADRAIARLNEFCDALPALYEIEVRSPFALFGKNKPLFAITQDDAAALGLTLVESLEATQKVLKSAVFDLNYRTWTSRLKTAG